jgi:tripartite-type tricarboxylate transporter receptor subunit TctC
MTKTLYARLALGSLLLAVASAPAASADYPTKQVTVFIGSGPGGATDHLARVIARHIEKDWGQPAVAINKPGAAGIVAATQLKSEAPDGHTIMVSNSNAMSISWQSLANPPYTVDDFTYISSLATPVCGWVARSSGAYKSWKDIVTAAKAGKSISFGAYSPDNRLMLDYVAKQENISFKVVNFKSTTEVMTAVLGGHVDFGFTGGNHVQHVKKGTMIAIAATDVQRLPDSPNVPTLRELGYDVGNCAFFMVAGPKGMPADVTQKLGDFIAKIVKTDEVEKYIEAREQHTLVLGPAEVTKRMKQDAEDYRTKLKQFSKDSEQ